jgi:predicted dehydrogenase
MTRPPFLELLDPDALFTRGDVYQVAYDEERAAKPTVRLAIVGAGGVAQSKYLPALARLRSRWEPVELVGLVTPDARQADKLRRTWHAPVFTTLDDLLERTRPDAVVICSPDELHAEHAIAALAAGAHVLVEKPIARRLTDAQRILDAAETAARTCITVCNKRYSPPYAQAQWLIAEGRLGQVRLFSGKFTLGYRYVDLLESGTIHLFDLARFLAGDVSAVHAVAASSEPNHDPFKNLAVSLVFRSGAVGSLVTSSTATSLHPWERVEVVGEGAWLAVDDQRSVTIYPADEGPAERWEQVVPHTLLSAEEWGGFAGLLDDFLDAVRGGRLRRTVAADGYRALELVAATQLSALGAGLVSLPLEPATADAELQGQTQGTLR